MIFRRSLTSLINYETVTALACMPLILLPFSDVAVTIYGVRFLLYDGILLCATSILFIVLLCNKGGNTMGDFRHLFVSVLLYVLLCVVLALSLINQEAWRGFGVWKSWFLLPMVYAVFLVTVVPGRKIFYALCCGTALVATSALIAVGIFQDAVTFDGRLRGFFDSPNQLAFVVGAGLSFILGALSQWHSVKHREQWIVAACGILCAGVLAATFSFGAWIGVLSAIVVSFLMTRTITIRRIYILASMLFVFLFLCGTIILLFEKSEKVVALFTCAERSSCASREIIWRVGVDIAKEYPILGVGLGQFQKFYIEWQQFDPPYLEWAVPHSHNFILFLTASGGIGAGLIGVTTIGILVLRMRMMPSWVCAGVVFFIVAGIADVPLRNDAAPILWTLWTAGLAPFVRNVRRGIRHF